MSEEESKKKTIVVIDKKTQEELDKVKLTVDELTDKVTQYEAEKAQSALEFFEKDKKDLLLLIEDPEKKAYVEEHVTTPQQLEFVKNWTSKIIEKFTPPKGKAQLEAPKDNEKLSSQKQYIEDLYKQARLSSDPQVRRKADAQIDKLWKSLGENPSWSKLQEDIKNKRTSGTSIVDLAISACPKCGSVNESSKSHTVKTVTCSKCGYAYVV